jgi:hypothetical protein
MTRGSRVDFALAPDGQGGTDVSLTESRVVDYRPPGAGAK